MKMILIGLLFLFLYLGYNLGKEIEKGGQE